MADSPSLIGTISGLTIASWGTTGAGTSTLGVLLSCKSKDTGEEYKVPTATGGTQGVIVFDEGEEVTAEILALDASAKPAKGSSLTIASVAGYVSESEISWAHNELKKINVTVKLYNGMTLGG